LHADEIRESFELGIGSTPPVALTSALHGTGVDEAATILLQLPSSGRSVRARWRERLLAFHERKILESPKLDDLLHQLAKGSIHLDEAMRLIGGFADE